MNQFRIEVAVDGMGHDFNIKPLEDNVYEIYTDEDKIGMVELDDKNHDHCIVSDCELDMPLINAIRGAIQAYQKTHS
jgi:hypothetical protein